MPAKRANGTPRHRRWSPRRGFDFGFAGGATITLAVVLGLGYLRNQIVEDMRYKASLEWQDSSCTLLETPTPTEDLSALGDGHCAFAGGGDLWNTLMTGSAKAKAGAVWLVNATAGVVRELEVESGESTPPKLVLHGIYFSRTSRRLYGVNHDEATGESVEVFDVVGDGDAMRLRHLLSVRSPLFGVFTLNDVVEGVDESELYVTEWQPFPFPPGGKAGAVAAPWGLRLGRALGVPIALLRIRTTRVFRCTLSTHGSTCEVASSARWVMANGIAISSDRRSVFVNDPARRTVTVLERGPDGSLAQVSEFQTKHILDNIEVDDGNGVPPPGRLIGGSMPLPYSSETVCEEAPELSATRVIGGRTVGCGASPGGLLSMTLLGTGGRSYVAGTQTDVAMHDGSKLSGVSSAVQLGGKVAMGSPNSPGVLLCDA